MPVYVPKDHLRWYWLKGPSGGGKKCKFCCVTYDIMIGYTNITNYPDQDIAKNYNFDHFINDQQWPITILPRLGILPISMDILLR